MFRAVPVKRADCIVCEERRILKPTLFLFLVAGACFARMRAESVASSVVRESSEAGLCNYARLAEAAANAGDYRRLNDYLEKITVAVKDAPGTLPVARALELTARLFLNISRGDDAIAPLARAEDIEERLAAPNSSEILHLRDTKAISLYDRGRYAEAERLWKSVIEIFEAKHQSGSVYAVAAAFHLGEFYTAAGDYKNADHIFTKLLGTTGLARDALCRPIVQAALVF